MGRAPTSPSRPASKPYDRIPSTSTSTSTLASTSSTPRPPIFRPETPPLPDGWIFPTSQHSDPSQSTAEASVVPIGQASGSSDIAVAVASSVGQPAYEIYLEAKSHGVHPPNGRTIEAALQIILDKWSYWEQPYTDSVRLVCVPPLPNNVAKNVPRITNPTLAARVWTHFSMTPEYKRGRIFERSESRNNESLATAGDKTWSCLMKTVIQVYEEKLASQGSNDRITAHSFSMALAILCSAPFQSYVFDASDLFPLYVVRDRKILEDAHERSTYVEALTEGSLLALPEKDRFALGYPALLSWVSPLTLPFLPTLFDRFEQESKLRCRVVRLVRGDNALLAEVESMAELEARWIRIEGAAVWIRQKASDVAGKELTFAKQTVQTRTGNVWRAYTVMENQKYWSGVSGRDLATAVDAAAYRHVVETGWTEEFRKSQEQRRAAESSTV